MFPAVGCLVFGCFVPSLPNATAVGACHNAGGPTPLIGKSTTPQPLQRLRDYLQLTQMIAPIATVRHFKHVSPSTRRSVRACASDTHVGVAGDFL